MNTQRILIIDDEAIVRVSCQKTLEPEGYSVDTASSGAEGLGLFEKGDYDLVLLDLKMPGMDGMETLSEMVGKKPGQPVMIMTGYDTVENMVDAIASGAAHYIEKPFTPITLLERIREVLDQ